MALINAKVEKPKTWAKMTKGEKATIIRKATELRLQDIERSPHSLIDELAIHFGVGIQS